MQSPPSDTDQTARLTSYVDVWWVAVSDVLDLAEQVPAQAWENASDLPGWSARDVLAHLTHLEELSAGEQHVAPAGAGDAPHVRNQIGRLTEEGVVARREATPTQLIDDLRAATRRHHEALRAQPPSDPDAAPPGPFAALGWDLETFLGNRPLDVWMHEQDLRRAVGLPGGLDGLPAAYTAQRLLRAVPFVVGKRVAPAPGTSVVVAVGALPPLGILVDENGRAQGCDTSEVPEPTATIRTDLEQFTLASGGRPTDPARWEFDGDRDLAQRIVANLAVTP